MARTPLNANLGRERQRGFTFVELLVTVIMIGLLAALMIPIFLSSRDKASGATAESLLRTGATTMESVVVDTETYDAVTPGLLRATEPNLSWLAAPGAEAIHNEVSVSGLGAHGYTLSTTTASGATYVLTKDITHSPTVTRTCGSGCAW